MKRKTQISALNAIYFTLISNFRITPIGTRKVRVKMTLPSSSSLGNGAGISERTQLLTGKADFGDVKGRTPFCDKVCSATVSLLLPPPPNVPKEEPGSIDTN